MKIRKPITEKQKITARSMIEAGQTYREVAESLDISIGGIHNIIKEMEGNCMEDIIKKIRMGHASKHLLLSDAILDRISSSDIGRARLKDMALASAILTDKAYMIIKEDKAENERNTPRENAG